MSKLYIIDFFRFESVTYDFLSYQGMSLSGQVATNEPISWDATDYQSSLEAAATTTVVPKTVDYAHGHGRTNNESQHV